MNYPPHVVGLLILAFVHLSGNNRFDMEMSSTGNMSINHDHGVSHSAIDRDSLQTQTLEPTVTRQEPVSLSPDSSFQARLQADLSLIYRLKPRLV